MKNAAILPFQSKVEKSHPILSPISTEGLRKKQYRGIFYSFQPTVVKSNFSSLPFSVKVCYTVHK